MFGRMSNVDFDVWKTGLTILTAVGTGIAALWKANESKNSKAIERLERHVKDCEDKHTACEESYDELHSKWHTQEVELAVIRAKLKIAKSGVDLPDTDELGSANA